ncbi:MAG: helix-turn-helix transcriptional regulator [Pirellulales bacterium]
MANSLLPDDPQTLQRLDSVACLLEWMSSMPAPTRKLFFRAIAEFGDAMQQVVMRLIVVIKNPKTTPVERQRALIAIADALFPNADENGEHGVTSKTDTAAESPSLIRDVQQTDAHQATFALRLRESMEAKRISQQELAERVGCSQPAISQMLNRNSRPQKKTILKLAQALGVKPCDLWPDMDVAEMLDAVASFQQNDYVMTEAEARALSDTSRPNRPKIQPTPLPTRRRQ